MYVTGYSLAVDPDGRLRGGACVPEQVARVRQVSEPGRRFETWRPVDDWRDRYQPPAAVTA